VTRRERVDAELASLRYACGIVTLRVDAGVFAS
jgi:hypothetical protein